MSRIKLENILFKPPRIIWHLVFWIVFISFFALVYGSFEEDYGRQYLILLTDAVLQIPAVYFTLYYLMPKFLFKERYIEFAIYLILLILLFSVLLWFNYVLVQDPIFWPDNGYEPHFLNFGKMLKNTTKIYPVLVLAIVIKWFKYWYREQKSNQLLVEEKLKAELNFLKAQVHPHFLFNTLNNLYALTLKKSKDAPEVVLKLSDLLNYMLYECTADTVLIEKEVKLLKDYISLEKIRYGDRLNISFNILGNAGGMRVAPLMLLPFVENSFKHGVSEEMDEAWVSIDLELKEEKLTLKVENSKSKHEERDDQFNYKQGIGLKNVRRRLELLYLEKHTLEMHDSLDSFLIILTLEL
ncbi:histidine kinase [Ekhidna sp.]|uniref:sensor histidine kinase n=1 Tax=Ekhidna sp. TaxID=2608089 RepID=UPI0032992EB2